MSYEGMIAETVSYAAHGGTVGEAYCARPLGPGPFPGMVVVHHAPGWDEWNKEVTRKFAHHGFVAICPNLFFRDGPGSAEDVAARVRAAGGVPDAQAIGDMQGAVDWLRAQPVTNGKVGIIGFCSGGRHAFLAACRVTGLDAAVDCWGGQVIVDDPALLTPRRPTAPIDFAPELGCPLLGIFGNDDKAPTPEQVDRTEAVLKANGKAYEFHRYDGAGHGFFATDRPSYRVEQAVDGWRKVFAFCRRHLVDAAG
jgi:carboxymethylenebutenolidase